MLFEFETHCNSGGFELLMAHGFPIASWATAAAGQFTGLDPKGWPLNLHNSAACRFAGNSMHVACIGLTMLVMVLMTCGKDFAGVDFKLPSE